MLQSNFYYETKNFQLTLFRVIFNWIILYKFNEKLRLTLTKTFTV